MTAWAKDNTPAATGYYYIGTIQRAFTAQWVHDPVYAPDADGLFYIWINQGGSSTKIDGPYPDKSTADTNLANAITALGGAT